MGNTEQTLYRCTAEGISFPEAVSSWSTELIRALAIAYGRKCTVTTLEEAPGDAFEYRVFNDKCELRWLKTGESTGDAVILSAVNFNCIPDGWSRKDFPENAIKTALDNEYLLWGEWNEKKSALFEHRVGSIIVPGLSGGKEGQRAVLKAIEYIGVDDKYGNCAVVAERLTGFAWHAGSSDAAS